MAARDDDIDGGGDCDCGLWEMLCYIWPGILGALVALLLVCPILYLGFLHSEDEAKIPEYRVAVAGFSGLDPDRDLSLATLDPTFDLTIRITEPRKYDAACFEHGHVASVSYAGVALARGPVPEFCAKSENVTERGSVMAWGNGMVVPQFARERLAEELRRGDAAVDVALVAPPKYCKFCQQKVLLCTAALGRGGEPSPPCRVIYQDLPEEYPGPGTGTGRKLLKPRGGAAAQKAAFL
uniref:Uncharacterized protein n=1 Tax=Avena sativa TaxID=4498 RepID=A0ACD5YVN9_AVESA